MHHQQLLTQIQQRSGLGTAHTSDDAYLGNTHPRYPITAPTLREIAKAWSRDNKHLSSSDFAALLTSLIEAPSSTEKVFAGILLDYSSKEQRSFNPKLFIKWLEHLEGWAEVDALCTNKYTKTHLLQNWDDWQPLLLALSKKKNVNMKRASLVFLCTPVRHHHDERLANQAFENITTLMHHKEVLITKAISWLLRSMVKYYGREVKHFIQSHKDELPRIAVRETLKVLETGTKTTRKAKAN